MRRHRRANPRRARLHRNYTVEEAARVLGTHKNTVRAWIKDGLPTVDQRRPTLILGADLRRFLESRRAKSKSPCPPGHLYCVRCRAPRRPAGNMADYLPITPSSGNLRGICPNCDAFIHRRVGLANLRRVRADVEVAIPEAMPRIGGCGKPSLDSDSN